MPQSPGTVEHPSVSSHDASQHSLPPPTSQVDDETEHEQEMHVSSVPLQ
jgi:hypothetical protein